MRRGKINFTEDNKPICPYCGLAFDRLASHTRQKHNISAAEFKKKWGLDMKKGICSPESSEKTRIQTLMYGRRVIFENLLKKGSKTRFQIGSKGRTRDQVSLETLERLKERLKLPEMKNAMKKSGYKLGKSGLGNKKRWNHK